MPILPKWQRQGSHASLFLPPLVLALRTTMLACAVCKRWQALGNHPQFKQAVKLGHVNEAISRAGPGDTLTLQPGFHQEVLLVEKPLRFVGPLGLDLQGRPRRGVVLQSNRAMAVMANARWGASALPLSRVPVSPSSCSQACQ